MFFDACDGIFTNYVWHEDMLRTSAELAGMQTLILILYIKALIVII